MDFDNSVRQLILRAGISSDDYTISIPVTRDSFNEASEGFMIVMRPDNERSNPVDVANINFQNNGVALGVIDDDDREFYDLAPQMTIYIHIAVDKCDLWNLTCEEIRESYTTAHILLLL